MTSSEKPFQIFPQKLPDENVLDDKIWINLNKCDKLFQEDKSEKFQFFNFFRICEFLDKRGRLKI